MAVDRARASGHYPANPVVTVGTYDQRFKCAVRADYQAMRERSVFVTLLRADNNSHPASPFSSWLRRVFGTRIGSDSDSASTTTVLPQYMTHLPVDLAYSISAIVDGPL